MNVTLRHLRVALAVARHSSFRRAAEELHLSQPALSLAVRDLERNLGLSVFDRTSRSVRTTEAGDAFLANAGRVIADFDDLITDIRNIARSRRGRVVVACLTSIAGRLMPTVIRAGERRYPAMDVVIRDEVAIRIADLVRFGEVDLGLTAQGQELHGELAFEPLFNDAFHVVVAKDHRLARRREVGWNELDGETLVAFSMTAGSHVPVEEQLMRRRVTLRRTIWVSHLATVTGMLEAGLGIGILPKLALPVAKHPTLVHRPLVKPALHRTIGLVTRKDRSLSPAAAGFCEVLRSAVR